MANVTLPRGVAVDLYAATGITPGVQLRVGNLSTSDVRLSTSEAGLVNDHRVMGPYQAAENDLGDLQAWALSVTGGGINVREA